MYVVLFTRCQSYRSYRRPSSWYHDLQDAAAAAVVGVAVVAIDGGDDAAAAAAAAVGGGGGDAAAAAAAADVAVVAAAAVDVVVVVAEDRCQTNLVVVGRWELSNVQRLEEVADWVSQLAAGPSDPTSKGSTRLSSNWIFMVADCSVDWRRAGEWNSRLEDHREASGPVLIAVLVIAALPLWKMLFYNLGFTERLIKRL